MHWQNWWTLGIVCVLVSLVEAQQIRPIPKPTPEVRQVLAPAGRLRVGLYEGNRASYLRDPASGVTTGVAFELGRELARWLQVPLEAIPFPNNGAVLEAVRAGKIDVIFTNATPARAKEIDFTQPYIEAEAGYLVPPNSSIATQTDIDKDGIRVGVMEGSTSSTTLPGLFKSASIVRVPNIATVVEMLSSGKLDTFATNKSVLFDLSDKLPGSVVLDGRYGVEQLALGIPKGRELGLPYVRRFIASAISDGFVKWAIGRSGFRGGSVKTGAPTRKQSAQ